MDDKSVSYFAYDSVLATLDKSNKRSFLVNVILIIALILSNTAWVVYECQYEDYVCETTIEAEQDATIGGANYIIGGDYGKAKSESNYADSDENEESKH